MSSNGVHVARMSVQAWGRILTGYRPNLSIEITKECPLRCPGCYAYGDEHLGGGVTLRGLADYKGDELVDRFMALDRSHRPLHVSIVGGEPLVALPRARIDPAAARRARHPHAARDERRAPDPDPNGPACAACRSWSRSTGCSRSTMSGARRRPTIASSSTSPGTRSPSTARSRVSRCDARATWRSSCGLWQANAHTRLIWISLYTPQKGEISAERLTAADRRRVIAELRRLRASRYPNCRCSTEC